MLLTVGNAASGWGEEEFDKRLGVRFLYLNIEYRARPEWSRVYLQPAGNGAYVCRLLPLNAFRIIVFGREELYILKTKHE